MRLRDCKKYLPVIISLTISIVILVILEWIGFEVNTDILLLFLLIFAMILIASGMVGELGVGSFYLKLRELSESEIHLGDIEKIDYQTIEKRGEEYLVKRLCGEVATTKPVYLLIKKNQEIGQATLAQYLRTNFFDYVIFLNENKLDAYIPASKLYGMLQIPVENFNVQNKINDWKLKEIPFMSFEMVRVPTNIGYILETLENKNINEIALVDKNGNFQGILTRQQLNNEIIKQLLKIRDIKKRW